MMTILLRNFSTRGCLGFAFPELSMILVSWLDSKHLEHLDYKDNSTQYRRLIHRQTLLFLMMIPEVGSCYSQDWFWSRRSSLCPWTDRDKEWGYHIRTSSKLSIRWSSHIMIPKSQHKCRYVINILKVCWDFLRNKFGFQVSLSVKALGLHITFPLRVFGI